MCLPLSRTPSQPEEIGRRVLPAAVDSGGVAQKGTNTSLGSRGRGGGKRGAIAFPCCQLLPRPHPGHKLLWVNKAYSL